MQPVVAHASSGAISTFALNTRSPSMMRAAQIAKPYRTATIIAFTIACVLTLTVVTRFNRSIAFSL